MFLNKTDLIDYLYDFSLLNGYPDIRQFVKPSFISKLGKILLEKLGVKDSTRELAVVTYFLVGPLSKNYIKYCNVVIPDNFETMELYVSGSLLIPDCSNKYCINCMFCINCVDCYDCRRCTKCMGSSHLRRCFCCKNCFMCSDCSYCCDSNGCDGSAMLLLCDNCIDCSALMNCDSCFACQMCEALLGCNKCSLSTALEEQTNKVNVKWNDSNVSFVRDILNNILTQ